MEFDSEESKLRRILRNGDENTLEDPLGRLKYLACSWISSASFIFIVFYFLYSYNVKPN
jgi:hypothetical protein